MQPDVSIVIVTWNGRQHLETCLAAVAAQTGVAAETIVVDNGSTDGTAEFVRARFPWVRVVAPRGEPRLCRRQQRRARARRADASSRFSTTTRRRIRAGCGRCSRASTSRRGFALATSRIVYMHDPDVIDSAGDGVLRWGGAFKRHHGEPASMAPVTEEVFGVCGAACLMPKAVFDELGGFDEDFFASHEDVDLSYRARLRGYRCRYVADAVVRHVGSATLGTREPVLGVPRAAQSRVDVHQEHAGQPALAIAARSHRLRRRRPACTSRGSACWRPYLRAKLAALAGLSRMLRKRAAIQRDAARRCSRDRAAARHAVAGDEAARGSASTRGWREERGERARGRGDPRQLQRGRRARARAAVDCRRAGRPRVGRRRRRQRVDRRQRRGGRGVCAARAARAQQRERRIRARRQPGARGDERAARAHHES